MFSYLVRKQILRSPSKTLLLSILSDWCQCCMLALKFCTMGVEIWFRHRTWASKWHGPGTSLMVQWLRLHASNAGGAGSIPDQGTRSHMPQLKIPHASTKDPACLNKDWRAKIPQAATKTPNSQNKNLCKCVQLEKLCVFIHPWNHHSNQNSEQYHYSPEVSSLPFDIIVFLGTELCLWM